MRLQVEQSQIEWRGNNTAYANCPDCGEQVLLTGFDGGEHPCPKRCKNAGDHVKIETRRRGPFWRRRTEKYCDGCGEILT